MEKQDLGRQGRGCPEAELVKIFKIGCGEPGGGGRHL